MGAFKEQEIERMEIKLGEMNAFPHFNQHGEVIHDSASGLSKLEYFTAMAMQGLAANGDLMKEHLAMAEKGVKGSTVPELALSMAKGTLSALEKDSGNV